MRLVALDDLRDAGGATRDLCAAHVADLTTSVAHLGLIHPLAVSCEMELLAGRHRLAALRQLRAIDEATFIRHFPSGCIPVHVLDVPHGEEARRRFAIEIAENEKRRDYTRDEVRTWAKRLADLGYQVRRGRPRKGERPADLMHALAALLGKSERTVRRLLVEVQPEPPEPLRAALVKTRRMVSACLRTLAEARTTSAVCPSEQLEEALQAASTLLREHLAAPSRKT